MTDAEFAKHKQEWRAEMAALDAEMVALKREQKQLDVNCLALDARICNSGGKSLRTTIKSSSNE